MDRTREMARIRPLRVPRVCGDGPEKLLKSMSGSLCSPRLRGWTVNALRLRSTCVVFPAFAGMDRTMHNSLAGRLSVPRVCGDGPGTISLQGISGKCSPRLRGWTGRERRGRCSPQVFPAFAGMDRLRGAPITAPRGVPRVCGDGPYPTPPRPTAVPCSPRLRGWTAAAEAREQVLDVFPAFAGMTRW